MTNLRNLTWCLSILKPLQTEPSERKQLNLLCHIFLISTQHSKGSIRFWQLSQRFFCALKTCTLTNALLQVCTLADFSTKDKKPGFSPVSSMDLEWVLLGLFWFGLFFLL